MLKTTCFALGVSTLRIGEALLAEFARSARNRALAANLSQENLTSSEVIARPLVGARLSHFMLSRRVRVTFIASGEISQDWAASPSTAPVTSSGATPTL